MTGPGVESEVPALLVETFSRGGRVNAAVLDALTPADLALSDSPGSNTIGELLAHIAGFRRGWLENISPAHAEGLPKVSGESDLEELREAFTVGDTAALKAVQDALRDGRVFDDPWKEGAYASNPAHFLLHTLIHDSHHRGQIMTLLRKNGRSKDQLKALEEATWPIWRE